MEFFLQLGRFFNFLSPFLYHAAGTIDVSIVFSRGVVQVVLDFFEEGMVLGLGGSLAVEFLHAVGTELFLALLAA